MAHFVNDFDPQARLAEAIRKMHEALEGHFTHVHERLSTQFADLQGRMDALQDNLHQKVDTINDKIEEIPAPTVVTKGK